MDGFDLVVRGGTLIGTSLPAGERRGDVGVRAGRVAAIGDLGEAPSAESLDATGLFVSAGWIDLHAHVFRPDGREGIDADADAGVQTGVTTVVDAGSFGAAHYEAFAAEVAGRAATRVLAFLNISVDTTRSPRHGHWDNFDTRRTLAVLEGDGGRYLLGVKVLASQTHCAGLTLEPVKLAVQAARLSGTRVMSHIGNSPPVITDVLAQYHSGDVVTHAWHGKPGGLLDRHGDAIPAARAAVERGVRFDMGHGSASFAFAAAEKAKAAGLPLHSVSTDIHAPNHVAGPVYDLATTMSKALYLGFDLEAVIGMVTGGAATSIGRERELGEIAVGRGADLTLFEVVEEPVRLVDAEGVAVEATRRLVPRHSVRAGVIHACRDALSRQAPVGD
jgi:dihydroorotase